MLAPGTRIGPYGVEERIGSGGRSEVYRGRHTALERPVAIKVLLGDTERDRREAQAVASIHHPNVLAVLDVLEHEGRLCIVQPWADGGSLQALLDSGGRFDLAETLRVGRDVAAALAAAHAHGILHRDVKPSNVLRDAGGRYQLADFGLLGRLDPQTGLTAVGQIAGTPLYMSPEQVTGAPQGVATDLFGLGLVLFRCLYGRLPDEASDGVYDLVRRRISEPIAVPDSALRSLIARCLALDPADRPASAAVVMEALAEVAAGSESDPALAPYPMQAPSAEAPPLSTRAGPAAPRALVAGAAVVLVGVVVVILVAVGDVAWGSVGLVLVGVAIAVLSIAVASGLRRRWSRRVGATERDAAACVLSGADERVDLTRSLMIEVDQFVGTLQSLDQKILGTTILVMLKEYEESRSSSDRQAALVHVVSLIEKVQAQRAPWHVRHRDSITTAVAVVGCLVGLTTALAPLLS